VIELLLPGNWNHIRPKIGINDIDPNNFAGRLYDHKEIIHAGVPSIFARAFAFTKALQVAPPDEQAMAYFSSLVQGIFLGIIKIAPYNLTNPTRLTTVMQEFEPDMATFYVLKWQNQAIGGIYPDCFVFPGAKFQAASKWRDEHRGESPESDYVNVRGDKFTVDITFQSLTEEINKRLACYAPDLVKALFFQWITEIAQPLANNQNIMWLDRLHKIANNTWNTSLTAPQGSLNNFTALGTTITLNNGDDNPVSISLRHINKNIFCEQLIEFTGGTVPNLPISAKYLSLIDIYKTQLDFEEGKPVYTIQLNNWQQSFKWQPLPENIIEAGEASILIWPDFKATGWNVNYVHFLTEPAFAGENPGLNLLDKNFNPLKTLTERESGMTVQPVEYIEIRQEGTVVGIFKDNRSVISGGAITTTMSLDFGTSNTSLGVFDNNTQQYVVLQFEDLTHDLLTGYWWKEDNAPLRAGSWFIPTASFEGSLSSLPSEILFRTKNDKVQGNISEPIKIYTVPFPYFKRASAPAMMVNNFKWSAPEGFNRDQLIKVYLKMVLYLALAQIRKEHLCKQVNIVPTYPLAFGLDRYDNYKSLYAALFADIKNETGITLNLAMVNPYLGLQELVAESYAVKVFSAGAQQANTAILVVDIGGGTTDIAMEVDGEQITESISYGGNVYLNYLANTFPDSPHDDNSRLFQDVGERIIALQKIMRDEGIRGVFAQYPGAQQMAAQAAMDRFFIGLFVYLYRLLEAYQIKNVDFHPVGNGWRLIEGYTPPHNAIPAYVKNVFTRWNCQMNVILPPNSDYKGAVCKGAIKVAKDGDYIHPVDITVKTIVGGSVIISGKELNWDEKVPTAGLGPPPLSFDTTQFVNEFVTFSCLPISQEQMNTAIRHLNTECRHAIYTLPAMQVGLNKSIMSVFLEKVYPELLPVVRGGQN